MVNDKRIALVMLVIIFFIGIAFFWCMLQLFELMIEATNVMPHFLEEGEELIANEVVYL